MDRRDEIVMQAIEEFQKAHPRSTTDVSVLASWMAMHLADRIVVLEQRLAGFEVEVPRKDPDA